MGTHPIFESDFDCLTEHNLKKTAKMAMSGVAVNDQCIKMWEKLKLKKIKACAFKLSSNLPEIECRYAIYDVEMMVDLGSGLPPGVRTKLTFIAWSPEKSKIRQRMVFSSSKDAVRKKLDGCQVDWQLTGADELEASDRIDDLSTLSDIKTSGNGILIFEGIKV